MSTTPYFILFDVRFSVAVTSPLVAASCFINCDASISTLLLLTITRASGTTATSGTLHLKKPNDTLCASCADYDALLDCMARKASTDFLRLKIFYDPAQSLDPDIIVATKLETSIEPSSLTLARQLTTLNHTSDAIADNTKRLAADLSGAVLQELKGLNQRTNEIAELIRKGVGLLGVLAPPEGDRRPPLGGKNANQPKGD
jgi:hypothetical protein